MPNDIYFKAIFSIIAIALSIIAWKLPMTSAANAQFTGCGQYGDPCQVRIVGGQLDYETDISSGPTLKVCTQC